MSIPGVRRDVELRFGEIALFLNFLRELSKAPTQASTYFPSGKQSSPVFKACTFLLLYNVVESCVRSAFGDVYDEIESGSLTFNLAIESVQEVWLKQQLDVPTDSANHQTYVSLATRIAGHISAGDALRLDSRKLPISGNLDSEAVRLLCRKHGVPLKVSKWAKGGAELSTIKDQRNALAHGVKSFSECGRDYSVKDLQRISRQTRHFLEGFLKSVEKYSDKKSFKK